MTPGFKPFTLVIQLSAHQKWWDDKTTTTTTTKEEDNKETNEMVR